MKLDFSIEDKVRLLAWYRGFTTHTTDCKVEIMREGDINLSLKIGEMLRQEEEKNL